MCVCSKVGVEPLVNRLKLLKMSVYANGHEKNVKAVVNIRLWSEHTVTILQLYRDDA